MTVFRDAQMAVRLLRREARSGELTLVLISLILAVTVATAIALFSNRLDRAMVANAADMLGADLRISSGASLPDDWPQRARDAGFRVARTLTFPSVVLAGDEMTLSALKAVDDGYPLRGRLAIVRSENGQPEEAASGPAPGEAWVEARLLALLQISLGDQIDVGGRALTVTAVISEESDRGGNFYTLSPRVMVHWDELLDSPMLGPGARVTYRLLLGGDAVALEGFVRTLNPDVSQQIETLEDGNQAMSRSLERARRYLGLAAVLAVVLAAVAVAISVRRYAVRHFDISALLRTFGLSRRRVQRIFALQLLLVGSVAVAVGAAAAAGLQDVLVAMLAGLIPEGLPAASPIAWISGISAGLVCLFGFGVPQILPLARVSPLRVLRRDLMPVPLTGWLIYALALGSVTLLLWLFTRDLALSAGIIGGGSVILLGLLFLLRLLLNAVATMLRGRRLPVALRFAWQGLGYDRTATAAQILAFALPLMVMLVTAMLRTDLLADWQRSLPQGTPNIFAMNIQDYDREPLREALSAAGIAPRPQYPMVPMRLTAVNGVAVSELPIHNDRAIDRDLISSSATQLPANNEVTAGDWELTRNGPGQVSVEAELAQRLGLNLGDVLSFRAAGVDFDAHISSLRTVDWTAMTPNFYMMLSPDLLSQLPTAYLTSFYLSDTQEAALTSLIRNYPGITFLDTRFLLSQLQDMLARITLAVELILVFVLAGALLVMLAVLLTTTRERLLQGAVLRTLGASRWRLQSAQWTEFGLLGSAAAFAALAGAELLVAGLYVGLLEIPYRSLGLYWFILPPSVAVLLALSASLMLRPVVNAPPLRVLQENN